MRFRSPVSISSPGTVLALTACLSVAVPRARASEAPKAFGARTCETQDPSPAEAAQVQAAIEATGKSREHQTDVGCLIQVALHILTDGVNGDLTDAQIAAQIDELNLDYSGAFGGYDTGYRFVLTSVDRTVNPDWFTMTIDSHEQKKCMEALAVDPAHHVNVYTADISSLGWSTFPWGVPEDDVHQGIVIDYESLPGGNIDGFNLGRTATHEIGHYLGLFHTFFGGCTEPNDFVDDTPEEAAPASGCPNALDSCPEPGMDPVHDYLDYSDDPCYSGFTRGQDERMDLMVQTYRPSFIEQQVGVSNRLVAAGVSFLPIQPNPANGPATLVFRLPGERAVRLRVVDLAGRTVATLADGDLAGGEHRLVFDPGTHASGVYFAVLAASGTQITRSLILAR